MPNFSHKQAIAAALPGTPEQIQAATGASMAAVFKWLARMRAEGACHIKRWRRTKSGQVSATYAPGPGEDARRPKRLTQSQYNRRAYVKSRQEPEKEDRAVRREARANASALAKRPNTWFGALPGAREVRPDGS